MSPTTISREIAQASETASAHTSDLWHNFLVNIIDIMFSPTIITPLFSTDVLLCTEPECCARLAIG